MQLVDQLKRDYIKWLEEKVIFSDRTNAIEITTPFLNSNQDYVQIYAVKDDKDYTLTDDGSTLNELYLAGFDFASQKRKDILNAIIKSFGVQLTDSGELTVKTTLKQFPQKKHALLQAMIKVNDMLVLSRRTVKNIFLDDVKQFLSDHDIRFTSQINIIGKSGYNQYIDIVIPSSKTAGERYIQAINHIDKNKVQSTLFLWDDIKEYRGKDTSLYVFVNDEDKPISVEHINAFKSYDVNVVTWGNRNKFIDVLSA